MKYCVEWQSDFLKNWNCLEKCWTLRGAFKLIRKRITQHRSSLKWRIISNTEAETVLYEINKYT